MNLNHDLKEKLTLYYKGKRILITGGLGFLGSNIAIQLIELGASVTLLDNMDPGYGGNFFNIQPIKGQVDVIDADIRDEKQMGNAIHEKDIVFHLAGQVCHVMSLGNPFPDIDINIKGTAILAEACRKHNPQVKIVFTGTRGQYGPSTKLPVSETAPTHPRGIYEISNLTAEKIIQSYNDVHNIQGVMLRLTNIYGYRSQMKTSRYGVVNWFVRLGMDGEVIPVFGDGKIKRDFLFIDDCVEAILLCGMDESTVGEVINIGHDQPQNFLQIAETLKEIDPSVRWEFVPFSPERKAQEPGDFYSDISKIKNLIGWSPQSTLLEGLGHTWRYYEKHRSQYW
jgi:UDP-glucose 4-epimerase